MKAKVRKSTCVHPSCNGKWVISYGNTTRRAMTWRMAMALAYKMMGA